MRSLHFPTLTRAACLLIFLAGACAADAATITGHIVDPDGRSVQGARVIVTDAIGAIAQSTTDANGRFTIPALAAGSYTVRFVSDGFQADPIAVSLSGDDTKDLSVSLRLSAVSESIVVSASQVEAPRSRTAETVTVMTAADLEAHQIETVSDALRLVPGLTVTRSGGRGAITSLFPRGGNSNYTLVLIDGIRANSFGGAYDFAHLSVADVDRIEVVSGPESALFGSDAIGAVVQVVTRRGGPPQVSGLVEAGGQGTTREAVGASGSNGHWIWGGGGEHEHSDGFTGIAPATGERVSNDDYDLSHVSGSLGYQAPEGIDFLVTGNIGRDERGFPGPYGSNPVGAFTAVDRVSRGIDDTRQIGVRLLHPWTSNIRQRVEANYTDLSSDFTSAFGPSSTGTRRFNGRVQEDFAFSPSFGASVGLEFQRERGTSTFITGATGDQIPIRRALAGAFAEARFVGSERLFATLGVRVDHITRDELEADPNGFPPRPLFPDQTVDSANPKVAIGYLLTPPAQSRTRTILRASAGTGIRPPDAFEIAFTNNPNLKPERSRSVDAGIEEHLAGGAYVLAATAFYNRYDDLIVAVGRSLSDASQYVTDNISNARSRGVELSAEGRPVRGLALRANYTFLDTEILSVDGLALAPVPFQVGDPLIRRPRHQGSLDLTYLVGRVSVFGEVIARGQILDVEPTFGASGGLFYSPGYAVINAGASVRIIRRLDAYARILNLADKAYEETLGFPALGRTGMIGIRVAASR